MTIFLTKCNNSHFDFRANIYIRAYKVLIIKSYIYFYFSHQLIVDDFLDDCAEFPLVPDKYSKQNHRLLSAKLGFYKTDFLKFTYLTRTISDTEFAIR